MIFSDLEIHERLGKGASAVVHRATLRKNGKEVAVKEIDTVSFFEDEAGREKQTQEMLEEVAALSRMSSPHIIKYRGSMVHGGRLYIVTEYAKNGDLHQFLRGLAGPLEESRIWRILLQTTVGLHHMHCKRILHRDVKTQNLFLCARNNIKIGDLGISKALTTMASYASTVVGTPYYLSPELCKGQKYDEKSDMWALGIVLYECCTNGAKPFDASNLGALIVKIMSGRYDSVKGYSRDLVGMIDKLLTHSPAARWSTGDILMSSVARARADELGIDLSIAAEGLSTQDFDTFAVCNRSLMSSRGRATEKRAQQGKTTDTDSRSVTRRGRGIAASANRRASTTDTEAPGQRDLYSASGRSSAVPRPQVAAGVAHLGLQAPPPASEVSTECLPGRNNPSIPLKPSTKRADEDTGAARPGSAAVQPQRPSERMMTRGAAGEAAGSLPPGTRARAIHLAREAVCADCSGDYESAFGLYQRALGYFELEIKSLKKGEARDILIKEMVKHLGRAEVLKTVLSTR